MQPRNYAELQKSSVAVQRKVYGWAVEIGPLLIRPDAHDKTRRHIINYYWNRQYFLTSAPQHIVVRIGKFNHIWIWHRGIHYMKAERRDATA